MKKPLYLHWSSSKPNFGDALSPLICQRISGRNIKHAKPNKADMIAVGSLLQRLNEKWFSHRLHVWGTGFIETKPSYTSRHYIHAVRGKHSEAILSTSTTLGDPGLLADLLLPEKPISKKFKIGFIEHYKDKGCPLITHLTEDNPYTTRIDIFSDPVEFLTKLSECEFIYSSAMHGLIAADSLGIPNAWIKLSDQVKGNDFKFMDYYSIYDIASPTPVELNAEKLTFVTDKIASSYSRPRLDRIKEGLIKSFPDI
jgi:hypothetical protein